MRITINKESLAGALAIVTKAISKNQGVVYLTGILVVAKDDQIELQATDLNQSVKLSVPALVDLEGAALIPSKPLNDIVRAMPSSAITIEAEEDPLKVHISCENATTEILSLDPGDFPAFPSIKPKQSITVPFEKVQKMISSIAPAAESPTKGNSLSGLYLEAADERLTMYATDSYRAALWDEDIESGEIERTIIPGSWAHDLASLDCGKGNITLGISDNQVIAEYEDTVMITRKLEGRNVDVRRLFAFNEQARLTVSVAALKGAINRAMAIAAEPSPLHLEYQANSKTLLVARSTSLGDQSQESIDCGDSSGVDAMIEVNYANLMLSLNTLPSDAAILRFEAARRPLIVEADDVEGYAHMMMPLVR